MKGFYDEVAEKSVIQAFLTRPNEQDKIGELVGSDFYLREHQQIFEAIRTMYMDHADIDLATIQPVLREMYGQAEPALMNKLIEIVTNVAYMETWALRKHIEIIKANALRRSFMNILKAGEGDLLDSENQTESVLEKVRQELRDIVITKHNWMPISDVLFETQTELERRMKGETRNIPSGIRALELLTNGFHPGELTIIGARPAVGKSALGGHIALAAAKAGYKVCVCSREMTSVQYGMRIVASGTDMDNKRLRTGNLDSDDWVKISGTMSLYSKYPISFIFSARYIEDLKMEVQKKVDSGELDILIVDYVQLMQTERKFEQDYLRIAYVSKMLKDMTVDFGISIIGLAQVGRVAESAMPTMAELRGSGDLEQDADNIIFMHKPKDAGDKYVHMDDKGLFQVLADRGQQYIVLNVAKQRQGETGNVSVIFDPNRMRFTDIQRVQQN